MHRALGLRNELLPGFDAAVEEFEMWLPLLLLRVPQALGFLAAPGQLATQSDLGAKIVPEYRRFTAEMLLILQRAGFVEILEDGTAVATAVVGSEATAARMEAIPQTKQRLQSGPARDIRSSIDLVWACLEALPMILAGNCDAIFLQGFKRISGC